MKPICRAVARLVFALPLAGIFLAPASANDEETWNRCMQQNQAAPLKPDDVIEACRTVLKTMTYYPNIRADAFNNIGVVYMNQKQYEDALHYFNEALRAIKDQQDVPEFRQLADYTLRNRAMAHAALKEYDDALADYEKIADNEPTPQHLAWRCRARALWAQEFATALPDCKAAIDADKSAADAYAGWMIVEYRQGKFAEVVADCKLIEQKGALSPEALYVCGLAERKAGDAKRGDQMVREANGFGLEAADRFKELGMVP